MRERYIIMIVCLFFAGVNMIVIGTVNHYKQFIASAGTGIIISGVVFCVSAIIIYMIIRRKFKKRKF